MRKVLTCHNFYQQTGGEDLSYRDEVELLRLRGHEVIEYTRHNNEVSRTTRSQLVSALLWNRRTYVEIGQLIEQHRPDIIHCTNTLPLISPSVYDAAARYGIPVVQSLRNYRVFCAESMCMRREAPCQNCLKANFAWQAIWNRCYRNSIVASAAVALLQKRAKRAEFYRQKVHAYYTLSRFAKLKMVEHGMDASHIHVKPNFSLQQAKMGKGDGGYFVFVGRLAEAKGIRILLQAWKKLSIRLKVIGDGPLAHLVGAAAIQNPAIEWTGESDLHAALDAIGRARALIFPSIGLETFGRTIMEAFSVGTPVIAARGSTGDELITDGVTGLLYDGIRPDQLANLLMSEQVDDRLRNMRTATLEDFRDKYSPERNYELLMQIYEAAEARCGKHSSTVSPPSTMFPQAADVLPG